VGCYRRGGLPRADGEHDAGDDDIARNMQGSARAYKYR
jgi:hypothetical protein